MYADMHIHTIFSDGTQTPEEVANDAANKDIGLISVCDHNSIGSYERLRPACTALGITLVQGVELNVSWTEKDLHLLAYNFDPADKKMLALIDRNQDEFRRMDLEFIEKVEKDHPEVSLSEFESYKKPEGRGGWPGLNYIHDCGLTEDLLTDGNKMYKKYGKKMYFGTLAEACKIVRAAGGVPVLAHPGIFWSEDELPDKLPKILAEGIGGLECYYPVHNESFAAKCVDFCKTNDLCIAAGCDGHGDFAQYERGVLCDLGVQKIDTSLLNLRGIV